MGHVASECRLGRGPLAAKMLRLHLFQLASHVFLLAFHESPSLPLAVKTGTKLSHAPNNQPAEGCLIWPWSLLHASIINNWHSDRPSTQLLEPGLASAACLA